MGMEARKAIPPHKTGTTDVSWDGPAAKKNLKLDGDESYYRQAYAWQDPDKDPATKAAYKFIHHEVANDGHIGAANIEGCRTGISVLNGGMQGTTIPDDDRQGVWDHLAGHIKDAGLDPAPLAKRSIMRSTERRTIQTAELRAVKQDDQPSKIVGYAALYNSLSEVMWGCLQECIAPGAFSGVIQKSDIRCLYNHDPNFVLGRMKAGTLNVTDDAKGLYFENTPPETSFANDLMISIGRGDVNQCSFAFIVDDDTWGETADGMLLRTINSFEELFDVSPVTYPAFSDTVAQVRSLCKEKDIDFDQMQAIVAKRKRQIILNDKEKDLIMRSFGVFKSKPEPDDPEPQRINRIPILRKRLDIAEKAI